MEPLDLFPFLSEIKPELEFIESRILSAEFVTLVAEPKLGQLISLSFIEASFLDNGILYNRKLVENIDDFEHTSENLCIYFQVLN